MASSMLSTFSASWMRDMDLTSEADFAYAVGGYILAAYWSPAPPASPTRQSHSRGCSPTRSRGSEARLLGVTINTDVCAEPADVLKLEPDVVIVATGGLPKMPPFAAGAELAVSSWDVLSAMSGPAPRR
jgi:hypothetical protein